MFQNITRKVNDLFVTLYQIKMKCPQWMILNYESEMEYRSYLGIFLVCYRLVTTQTDPSLPLTVPLAGSHRQFQELLV